MPSKTALAKMILENSAPSRDGSADNYAKIAHKEAGDAFIRAIQSGDGEAVALALKTLSSITAE